MLTLPARRLVFAIPLLAALAACGSPPRAAAPAEAPPALHGVESGFSGTIEALDGLPLQVEARVGPGPTLVFVHGWMCRGSYWDAQVEAFGDDHGTVVLDLGGHGASGTGRAEWSLDVLAGDVVAVLDRLDLHDAILVGHSMGGPISLKVAAARPERVIGIVGVDSLHDAEFRWPEAMMDAFVEQLERDWQGSMQQFMNQMFVDSTGPAARRLMDDIPSMNKQAGIAIMRSYADLSLDEDFQRCPVPVRCINAATPLVTHVDRNRGYLPGFGAVTVEGAGHFLQMEDPGTFNALMENALDDLRDEG